MALGVPFFEEEISLQALERPTAILTNVSPPLPIYVGVRDFSVMVGEMEEVYTVSSRFVSNTWGLEEKFKSALWMVDFAFSDLFVALALTADIVLLQADSEIEMNRALGMLGTILKVRGSALLCLGTNVSSSYQPPFKPRGIFRDFTVEEVAQYLAGLRESQFIRYSDIQLIKKQVDEVTRLITNDGRLESRRRRS